MAITGINMLYSQSGMVSLTKAYQIIYWLEYGNKLQYGASIRFPNKVRDSLINHFGFEYSKIARKYILDPNKFFEIIKNDYPKQFQHYNITDYVKLCYLAT